MPQHTFSIDGVELHCRVNGVGKPVVLLHGFPFDHTMWQEQMDPLSATYQVLAPDLRGYGRSTQRPSDAEGGVDMRRYAADIEAMLDSLQLREPVILCGFSMGGYIVWQLALHAPERVGGIVLCDTRAAGDTDQARQGRLSMAAEIEQSGVESVVDAMLPKLLAQETLENRPEIAERVANMIRQVSPAAIAAAQRGMARRPDVSSQLADLDIPALVLVGAEDTISTPAEMREIATALPQAQFVEVPAAAHMTPLENPSAVTSALYDFLAKL